MGSTKMEGTVKFDKWGYEVGTSSDMCISAINAFYVQVLSYGRERSVILEALSHDKDCVLANVYAAYFISTSDSSRASHYLEAAKSSLDKATSYEKAVFDTISYLMSEARDDDVAIELHSKLLKEFPRDLASLKRAQLLSFYMGRSDLTLSFIHQILPENEGKDYIYGILAFALLEVGQMRDAEEAAKKGFAINKHDSWSQHALCHVLQYECRFQEAVQFMEECSSSWSSCLSFMLTHNWWHVALCYLEGNGPRQRILDIYDHHIWKELDKTDAVKAEVYLNAVGLSLRLYVRGDLDFFQDRFEILVGCLTDQANWHAEWHLDVLTVWALAKTGKISKALDLLKGLKDRISKMTEKKKKLMQRALLLAEALYAYGTGDDRHGLELLGPDFDANNCKIIGASDEQVDVFNEVWYSMLLNTRQATKAIEALERRIKKREGIPFLWHLLERGYKQANMPEAKIASEKVRALESAYFN